MSGARWRGARAAALASVLAVLVTAYAVVPALRLAAARLAAPEIALEYGEGFVLVGAELLRAEGVSGLYPAALDEPPLQIGLYGPGMYAAWAGLSGSLARGADFLGGRIVAAAGWALAAAMVFAIARALGARAGVAIVAALALLTTPLALRWLALARVDVPAVALAGLGLFAILRGRARPRVALPLAAAAFAAALLFRQSTVAAPAAAFLHLLLAGRTRDALLLAAVCAGIAAVVVLPLVALSDGGFLSGVLFAAGQDLALAQGLATTGAQLLAWPLPGLATLAALPLLVLGWRGPARLVTLYWLLAVLVCAGTAGKVGANTNYVLEPLAATFLAAAVGATRVAEALRPRAPALAAAAPVVVTWILAGAALAERPAGAMWLRTQQEIARRAPRHVPLPEARGHVVMNPGLLPLTDLPVTRLYWSDPYAMSLQAATDRFDGTIVTDDLGDGTVGMIVESVPLERQPQGRPRFPGDFENGWGPWSHAPWLSAARANFERVRAPGTAFAIYVRKR